MHNNTKKIALSGVCVAMSLVLGMINLFSLPMGGSVTACSMLFATLPGFFFGGTYGFLSGLAYGALSFILKPCPVYYGLCFSLYRPRFIRLIFPKEARPLYRLYCGLSGTLFLRLLIRRTVFRFLCSGRYESHLVFLQLQYQLYFRGNGSYPWGTFGPCGT